MILAVGIWFVGHWTVVAHAENHALLIGIGDYSQRTLEGPPYDVQALSKMLLEHYGFNSRNLRTLVNQEAVKSRILEELQRLTRSTGPGDHVFIYYSGHGTSRRDELLALPLPHGSGALVPADFNVDPNQSIEEQMSQLVVGQRDLRPILVQLDRDRKVLVVFDTCFSGNTVRGIGIPKKSEAVSRYLPLGSRSVFSEEQQIGSFSENLKTDEPYPYRNTFYISASTENETAKDIRKEQTYLFPTIDGNPHGVLTDSLLRVLAGQTPVDTNNDGSWSQIELYRALRSEVQRRFKQTPQALPKEGESAVRLHDRAFFVRSAGSVAVGTEIPARPKRGLGVLVADDISNLQVPISQIKGVQIVKKDPDLRLIKDRNDIVLTLPNHHQLCRFTTYELQRVQDRIRRHARIQPLIDLAYPRQQFNVSLELIGPYQKSIIAENESFGFEIYSEQEVFILLLDIDPAGAVHVLYPFEKPELQPIAPGVRHILTGKCRALWPFGTETLKLFAFIRKPDDLEAIMGKQNIYPESTIFMTLERIVGIRSRTAPGTPARMDAAQTTLKITSYARTDLSR
jgi:hypothetical protein